MIQFRCECGKLLQAREDQAGLSAACPICGHISPVPEPPRPVGLTAEPIAPVPLPAPTLSPPPALHPDPIDRPRRRSPWVALLGAAFVLSLIAGGAYLGWRHNRIESRAYRMLEAEIPKQHGIQVKSIELHPIPASAGGEEGDFTGTVIDQEGKVWELVRVRVTRRETQWLLREPEEKMRRWIDEKVSKLCASPVRRIDLRRTEDNRRVGEVVTESGVVLELEEEPVKTLAGRLAPGQTRLQVKRESMPLHWELTIRKAEPNLVEIKLKEDAVDSWSGIARDKHGARFAVTVKRRAVGPQPGDDEKGQFEWLLLPMHEK